MQLRKKNINGIYIDTQIEYILHCKNELLSNRTTVLLTVYPVDKIVETLSQYNTKQFTASFIKPESTIILPWFGRCLY